MSFNENQLDNNNNLTENSKKIITEESERRLMTDEFIQQNPNNIPNSYGDQDIDGLNETVQKQIPTEENQQFISSKEKIDIQIQEGPVQYQYGTPSEQKQNLIQQNQDSSQKKRYMVEQNEIINDSFITQQSKKVKAHLLFNQIQKPEISHSFPFSQGGVNSNTQQNQFNYFFYDNTQLENANLLQSQKDRKQMQQYLQTLQNRVLLLEKEDKMAQNQFKNMQKQTQKILLAKKLHEERRQLNEYVRQKRESEQQQKFFENKFNKNIQRASLQSRMNETRKVSKQKADTLKQQMVKYKMQHNINNEQINLNNIQQYNQTKYSQKQQQIRKITHSDDRKKIGANQYTLRIQYEESISRLKEQEYQELEEKEKQLLARLQQTQTLFNHAVQDMQKVISIPIQTNNNDQQANIQIIKNNILNQNTVTPQASQLATSISENFIQKQKYNKLAFSTYQFPSSEASAVDSQNIQYHKFSLSGSQSAINAVANQINQSQNSPLQSESYKVQQQKSSDQLALDGDDEDLDQKMRITQVYSSHRNHRQIKPTKQYSQQSSSVIESRDPFASTTGSAQFKFVNNPSQDFNQSGRNFYNVLSPSGSQRQAYSNTQSNFSVSGMMQNLNIGKPYTPTIGKKSQRTVK